MRHDDARALGLPQADADDLADLLARTGAPVTARLPWLATWAACWDDHEPLPVLQRCADGTLAAAALLAVRPGPARDEVVAVGHAMSDEVRLPARSAAAASALAVTVAARLHGRRRPWRLRLEQLPGQDPVADALGPLLPLTSAAPGGGCPVVRFTPARRLQDHTTDNLRKNVRKGWNRLRRAGSAAALAQWSGPDVVDRLDRVAQVHVRRDHDAGRRSDLDDPRAARFWREVLHRHAERDELVLWELEVDGRLAAYALGLADGESLRVWDGRFDPDFAAVNAGRLLQHGMLEDLLGDPRFAELDWMRGEEPYKLQTADTVVPHQQLRAWSGPVSRGADLPAQAVGQGLRAAKRRWPQLEDLRRDLGRRRWAVKDPARPADPADGGAEPGAPRTEDPRAH